MKNTKFNSESCRQRNKCQLLNFYFGHKDKRKRVDISIKAFYWKKYFH